MTLTPLDAARRAMLQAQQARLAIAADRPWLYRELHHPWSRGAALVDAWAMLDFCRALVTHDTVRGVLGHDVILFDSGLLPVPHDLLGIGAAITDFPVDPPAGAVILVALGEGAHIGRAGKPLRPLFAGEPVLLPAGAPVTPVVVLDRDPMLFAFRFFPASSRYARDPADIRHVSLMERLPLVNLAAAPLHLIAGEDRAGNDLVTGFASRPVYWSGAGVAPH